MNANDYLKDLLGEEPVVAPTQDGPPAPAQPVPVDPRIQAALDQQQATFKEELDKRDAALDAKINPPPRDPDTYVLANGRYIDVPNDEGTWRQWLNQAQLKTNEDPSLEPILTELKGKYFAWKGRSAAEKIVADRIPPPEREPTPEQTAAVDIARQLDHMGLAEGTKGRIAVETLMEGGKYTLDQALDLIGASAEGAPNRTGPVGAQREQARAAAANLPPAESRSMAPPREIVQEHRGDERTDRNAVMNAALAKVRAKKRSANRIFN
jgi:hypothetical protein